MTTNSIVPCIWFDDQAEQASAFYAKTFPRGRTIAVSHYPEATDNPGHKPRGSVLTVEFEIAGRRFTALNGGPQFVPNPSVSFFAIVENAAAADALYGPLVEGGEALMEIGKYPWSERYGWVKDRFGVSWQVMASPAAGAAKGALVAPCLMFAGARHGKAEEALRAYAAIFPNGKVEEDSLSRYVAGEVPEGAVGTLKHGRAVLDGQPLFAMDSHLEKGPGFNEALSLQVMCNDQREIDKYWAALTTGGEPGPCGWLKDRFGLSWQVVPTAIRHHLTAGDTAARDRAFAAMMTMKKPDVAALDRAFQGA